MSSICKESNGTIGQTNSTGFIWEIDNFCFGCKHSNYESPVFSTDYNSNLMDWCLKMEFDVEEENTMALYLKKLTKGFVTVDVKFSILNKKNDKMSERDYNSVTFYRGMKGYNCFVKRDFFITNRNTVLEENRLRILCEIFHPVYTEEKSTDEKSKNVIGKNAEDLSLRLVEFDHFEKLFLDNELSDVTFVIGEKKIQAHRLILASRSPIFKAMLQHDMKEKNENVIEIQDIAYEVLRELLRFVYAGKVDGLEEMACDLILAADKYCIDGLKVLCEKAIFEDLNVDNAMRYLEIATMSNACRLKSQILEFILTNAKEITEKPEFETFGNASPDVARDIIRAIAKREIK